MALQENKEKKVSKKKKGLPIKGSVLAYNFLLEPWITEKSHEKAVENKYFFKVTPDANKQNLKRAIEEALSVLETIRSKSQFWETVAEVSLNERQRKIINRMLDGFEGKLTSTKWAKIAKCSQDTAYRDILDLV